MMAEHFAEHNDRRNSHTDSEKPYMPAHSSCTAAYSSTHLEQWHLPQVERAVEEELEHRVAPESRHIAFRSPDTD